MLPLIPQLTGRYTEDSFKQSSMRGYLHVPRHSLSLKIRKMHSTEDRQASAAL